MARPGFTEDGKRIQPVANYNPVTGEYEAGGGGGGSISAVATAAAPTYVEGESEPLSMDLGGNLRIGGVISAETATTATVAAPTYVEASADNPLSTNLTGDLRVIAKASGSFPVTGTFWQATQPVSLTTLPALATGANAIGSITNTSFISTGNVAHDAADSGNPIKVGGKAYASAPAAVGDGDRVDQAMTLRGGAHTVFVRADGTIVDPDAPASVFVQSSEYETVAASQTDQILGTTGAIGDKLEALLVTPTSTTVGAISIEDGSTNTVVYAGGTVGADLKPFIIPLFGIAATTSTGWEITTGAGATLIAFGQFT